jgi:hypothetical protein
VKRSMAFAVASASLCFVASASMPAAVGQEKAAESSVLDPRLKPLIGTWEGRVRWANSRAEEGRILVIEEKAGQLQAQYGLPGQKLSPVNLSVETSGSRLKVGFTTGAGNPVALYLEKDDYLTGTFTVSGSGRGGGSPERPMDLQRKK